MLEARSPLGAHTRFDGAGLALCEAPDFELTQLAGDEKTLARALGPLPAFGQAVSSAKTTLVRVSPRQVWLLGPAPEGPGLHVTPLSSGRTRLLLEGARARSLLAACAAVDFSANAFPPGTVAMTGFHHTPVLIHCTGENSFHIYALRSFALSVWEWLVDAAQGL